MDYAVRNLQVRTKNGAAAQPRLDVNICYRVIFIFLTCCSPRYSTNMSRLGFMFTTAVQILETIINIGNKILTANLFYYFLSF